MAGNNKNNGSAPRNPRIERNKGQRNDGTFTYKPQPQPRKPGVNQKIKPK